MKIPAAFILTAAAQAALAIQCTEVSKVCIDSEDRLINGVLVHKDCWKYERTFECLRPNPNKDGCSESSLPEGCRIIKTGCSDGISSIDECPEVEARISCTKRPEGPLISEVEERILIERNETVEPEVPEDSGCRVASRTCLESGVRDIPVENEPGRTVPHHEACWREALQVSCPSEADALSCEKLEAAGCERISEKTCEEEVDGVCIRFSYSYLCRGGAVEGDDIEVGDPEEAPDGTIEVDKSDCEAKLKEEADKGSKCEKLSEECTKTNEDGECLEFTLAYSCERSARSTCSELEELAGTGDCRLEKEECTGYEDGACSRTKFIYSCGTRVDPNNPPGEAELVDKTEIIEAEPVDTCTGRVDPQDCRESSRTCTSGPGIRLVDGVPVYKDCWQTSISYVCRSSSMDDCAQFASDPDCRLAGSECPDEGESCERPTKIYECTRRGEDVNMGRYCDDEVCIAGVCTPVSGDPDDSFADAVVGIELSRQLGMYADLTANDFFAGDHLYCRDRMGAPSCCRKDVQGAVSNQSALGYMIGFGLDAGFEFIKYVGSPYVYDILAYSDSTSKLLTAIYGQAGSGVYDPSLSFWGVTASYSQTGGLSFNFSPQGFLASAAVNAYMQYKSCRAEDQKLALARGRGLCVYLGTTCGKTGPGGCIENRQHYMCFNSKLAKIINIEGRRQLGRSFGTPDNPDERGFTAEELEKLDFSEMDFSDFVADVIEESKHRNMNPAEKALARGQIRVRKMLDGEIGIYAKVPGATARKFIGSDDPAGTPAYMVKMPPNIKNRRTN